MELTPELLGTGAVGIVVIAGAIGNYLLKRSSAQSKPEPVSAGFSLGWFDGTQTERLLSLLERIAKALETLADRDRAEVKGALETLLDQLHQRPQPPSRK